MPGSPRLTRGDLPPRIVTAPPGPPGPRGGELGGRLAAAEAPGVNTWYGGAPGLLWEEACGANVLDVDGNRYVDLTAGFGVAAVGHRHPRIVDAVRQQAGRLLHGLGDVHGHPARVELAERLSALAPVGAVDEAASVYPAISGADAVEVALKTALLATGRPAVLAFDPGYHGLTLGALATTSRAAFRAPFAAHLHRHVRRLPYGCATADLTAALSQGDVACAVVEPVVGREGVIPPPPGWLPALAAACRDAGTLLVADEVFTGFGRTGSWFAVEHEAVRPDLLVCGKALGGGLPLGAVVAPRRLLEAWRTEGEALHTATFVAHPLSCAAALAVLDVLEEEALPARAARLGTDLEARLSPWLARYPQVTAVRGRGLLWGIELQDRQAAARLVHQALTQGILLLAGGPEGRVAQLVPPLVITESQLEIALQTLESILAA